MVDLSSTDRSRIQRAQRVLLSPLHYLDVDAWLRAAAGVVQDLLGADRSYAFRVAPDALTLIPNEVDPAFKPMSESYLAETMPPPNAPSENPLPIRMHIQRMKRGSGVYHEQHLVTREEVEQSPFFQEVAAPFGVRHATGLSTVESDSETVLCVAFKDRHAPGFTVEASERLSLLVPAFEVGLRHLRRLHRVRIRLRRVLDDLTEAIFLFSVDGRELYRNRALRHLLQSVHDPAPLCSAAMSVALDVAELRLSSDASRGRQIVERPSGQYALSGTYAGPLLDAEPGVLVIVTRRSPYPPPFVLQNRWGLTPREADVALLIARGRTDAQVAAELEISVHTVRRHASAVRTKLGAKTRTEVAYRIACWKVAPPNEGP